MNAGSQTSLLFLVSMACALNAQSLSTNDVFITYAVNENTPAPKNSQIEMALNAKESRPAAQDPEGNWGEPANGFQLSLRFEKKVFTLGEPITGDVFLRNVSASPLERSLVSGSGFESKLCQFIMTREGGGLMEKTNRSRLFSVRKKTLSPKAQWKCPARLDEIFRIEEPGSYLVTGLASVGEPAAQIRSGNVLIRVVAKDTAASPDIAPRLPEQVSVKASLAPPVTQSTKEPVMIDGAGKSPMFNSRNGSAQNAPTQEASPTPPPAFRSTSAAPPSSAPVRKLGMTIAAVLTLLLLAILGRAARRKRVG
jgi:hypothetical protein